MIESIHFTLHGISFFGQAESELGKELPRLCRRIDNPGVICCKNRPKIRAVIVEKYFIKRYNLPGFFTQLKRRFRLGRAEHVRRITDKFLIAGIPVMHVAAALTEVRGLHWRDLLITDRLPENAVLLDKYALSGMPFPVNEVVKLVADMHCAHLTHGDLNLRNIYFVPTDNQAGFIDLDGAKFHRFGVSISARIREMARLYSSLVKTVGPKSACSLEEMLSIYRQLTQVDLPLSKVAARSKYLLTHHSRH